jgi:hypothetical protein
VAALQGNIQEARRLGEISLAALEGMQHRDTEEVRNWLGSITDQRELREHPGKRESNHDQA